MPWDTGVWNDPYNLPYLLTLFAYIIHEMLGLRLVLAGAHLGYLVLAVTGGHMAGIFWNVLFLALNLWHAGKLLWARRKIRFEPTVEALYNETFASLNRREFLEFWNQGESVGPQEGVWLAEGHAPTALALVTSGTVLVEKNAAKLNQLGPGRFFAEMGYLTRQPASATIRSAEPVTAKLWAYPLLERVERDNPDLWVKLQGVLGREMARKIAEQNPR